MEGHDARTELLSGLHICGVLDTYLFTMCMWDSISHGYPGYMRNGCMVYATLVDDEKLI